MQRLAQLAQTKTFWLGVSAVIASIVHAFFPHGEVAVDWWSAVRNLLTDPQLFAGAIGITLRDALARIAQPKE